MAYIYDDEGNYKKTCYCRWCYEKGHNSRACPQRYPNGTPAQQRKAAREAEKAERKRLGVKAARKCTFCGEEGHIRRKCSTLAADKRRVVREICAHRAVLVAEIKSKGIGPGALVAMNQEVWSNGGYTTHRFYSMVTGLDYSQLDPHKHWTISKRGDKTISSPEPLETIWLTMSSRHAHVGDKLTTALPCERDSKLWKSAARYAQAITPQLEVVYRGNVNVPLGFLSRQTITKEVDQYFKSTKTKEHYNFLSRLDALDASEE